MASASRPDRTATRSPIRTVAVTLDTLVAMAKGLHDTGSRLKMLYLHERAVGLRELRYVIEEEAGEGFTIWRCEVETSAPSLAETWPLISWDEREIMDLSDVRFVGHPDPRPLLAQPPSEIVDQNADGDRSHPVERTLSEGILPEIVGADSEIQTLPFGPIRAGVVESGAFFFEYVGEHIIEYRPQLFFKHRGMEARFVGLSPGQGAILAERISAIGSVGHAIAYAQAIEAAGGLAAPTRARWVRSLLGELERLYNHLHFLGHLADTTTLKVGHAEGMLLEERAKRLNARLTGSRFLRNIVVPGGLRRDVDPANWLAGELTRLHHEAHRYVQLLKRSDSFSDRLLTTGPLPTMIAYDQGATGPVARASDLPRDLRLDHPYAAYPDFVPAIATDAGCDAHARFHVRVDEIEASFSLLGQLLANAPKGPVHVDRTPTGREGLGWAEGPRGAVLYAVHLDADGRLAQVKVRSPSFSNWRAFPFTVQDSNMMDYAINEASFGLSIAGCDR